MDKLTILQVIMQLDIVVEHVKATGAWSFEDKETAWALLELKEGLKSDYPMVRWELQA